MLLLVIVPVLLGLGRPVTLGRLAAPAAPGHRRNQLVRSGPVRMVVSPVAAPLVMPVVAGLVFFTPLLETGLRFAWVRSTLALGLLAVGFVTALRLTGALYDDHEDVSAPLLAGLFLGFLELLLDAIPGIVVRLQTHLLALGYFRTLTRPWGPSPRTTQQHAGAILWFVGAAVEPPFLALVVRLMRSEERAAARIDRELDRQAAAMREATTERQAPPPETTPPTMVGD